MTSRINGAQQPSRDLFGGVLQSNSDIFHSDSPKNSRFHQLKLDIGDRSSDDISVNSPNRRTPIHKQHSDFSFDVAPSLSLINQKTDAANASNNTPLWFHNPKRRTVPSHVIKREQDTDSDSSSFLTKTKSSSSGNSSGFNTVTFGTRKNASESSHVNALSDELPPTRTISDLRKEDNTDSYLSFQNDNTLGNLTGNTSINNINSTINSKDSQSTRLNNNILPDHLFKSTQPNSVFSTPTKSKESAVTFPLGLQQPIEQSQESQLHKQDQKLSGESAVLVFGYPESIANNVIKYFSKFGTILEDFESTRINPIFNNKKQHKIYPIYTGNGWVKLTYANKASAIRALEESGSVYLGAIIGCVPYSKEAVEKIASVSINDLQNIGESEFLSNGTPLEKNNDNEDGDNNDDLLKFNPNKKSTRLSLKNDDKIFIKSKDLKKTLYSNKLIENSNSTNNNSVFNRLNNWLFGWEDL